jgi:hypothetical protein
MLGPAALVLWLSRSPNTLALMSRDHMRNAGGPQSWSGHRHQNYNTQKFEMNCQGADMVFGAVGGELLISRSRF